MRIMIPQMCLDVRRVQYAQCLCSREKVALQEQLGVSERCCREMVNIEIRKEFFLDKNDYYMIIITRY